MTSFAAILPAAGTSRRFGAGRSKLYAQLGDVPVIVHAVRAFTRRTDVTRVFIPANDLAELETILGESAMTEMVELCDGGASRAESVLRALRRVDEAVEWVAIHDAARPLVSQELIDRTLAAAVEHGAAGPAVPVSATIKQAGSALPARAAGTVPRKDLWAMQTPQIMRRRELLDAYARCPVPLEQVTDDLQLLELAGGETWLIPGDERNIKITTPLDLKVAAVLLGELG